MPRRAPLGPLAVTLGAHLLLAWWWIGATGVRMQTSSAPALREFYVVLTPPASEPAFEPAFDPASRSASEPPPRPALQPAIRPPTRPTARPVPRAARTPDPARAPAITAAPADAPAADALAAPYPDPLALPAAQDGAAPDDASLAGRARRAAGSVDHGLRKGKLAPLDPADTPWKRFASAVEGARKDSSLTLTSESYTSPDGTIVYRFRKNGRYFCRSGGGVKPGLFGAEGGGAVLFDKAGGGGTAGMVPCPSGAQFRRD